MVWINKECQACCGMGIVLKPDYNAATIAASDDDTELCKDCLGFGRVPQSYDAMPFVESMLLWDGCATRTKRQMLEEIAANG